MIFGRLLLRIEKVSESTVSHIKHIRLYKQVISERRTVFIDEGDLSSAHIRMCA